MSSSEDECVYNPYSFVTTITNLNTESQEVKTAPKKLIVKRPKRKCTLNTSYTEPVPITIDLDAETSLEQSQILVSCNNNHTLESRDPSSCDIITLEDSDNEGKYLEELVKVSWQNHHEIDRFDLPRSNDLKPIFEFYAKKQNCSIDEIEVQLKGKSLGVTDMVSSLNMGIRDVLTAGLKCELALNGNTDKKFKINCRTEDRRSAFVVHLEPKETFERIFSVCASRLNYSVSDIKIKFDGTSVYSYETAEDVGLEDDDCLDIYIIKSPQKNGRKGFYNLRYK